MWKACSRCGKIHDSNYQCYVNRENKDLIERQFRRTYKWTQKSLEIREKANWLCEVCRDQDKITYENLEVHHIDKIKEASDKVLDDFNLICLCREHHYMADSGEIDKEYLRELAKRRELPAEGVQKNPPVGMEASET